MEKRPNPIANFSDFSALMDKRAKEKLSPRLEAVMELAASRGISRELALAGWMHAALMIGVPTEYIWDDVFGEGAYEAMRGQYKSSDPSRN